ncbi:MAG: hypothetical protein STSR0004_10500 [Peptococcaceae bacterium]
MQAFAHEDRGNIDELPPTAGVVPDNGYPSEPGGTLSKSEIKKLLDKETKPSKDSDVAPQHAGWPHSHYFLNIYNRYDGYHDRGEVASGYNGKSSIDTLSFTITRTVSNGWNCSIGFAASIVSGGVGYDVNWSTSKSWSYSATVNPYKTVHIGYQDWYQVQMYNVKSSWYFLEKTLDEYGNGWAKQWFKPHFYSWET